MTARRLPCIVLGQRDDGAWRIGLTQGLVALVDDADLALVVATGKWYAHRNGHTFYAEHGARKNVVKMHHLLTGWAYVDHINGHGFDNRRSNLREATHAENTRNRGLSSTNTSGFKGVHWEKSKRSWAAQIRMDGRTVRLGSFHSPEAAAREYDAAAEFLHGEFARTNFPRRQAS